MSNGELNISTSGVKSSWTSLRTDLLLERLDLELEVAPLLVPGLQVVPDLLDLLALLLDGRLLLLDLLGLRSRELRLGRRDRPALLAAAGQPLVGLVQVHLSERGNKGNARILLSMSGESKLRGNDRWGACGLKLQFVNLYRLTHKIVHWLLLTSKQKFSFSIRRIY